MMRVLIGKYIGQSILLWFSCALVLVGFNVFRVWLVSQMEMERFRRVIEELRDYERYSPVPFDQLFTYPGRISMAFDEPIVLLCIVVWVIARGSDVVAGQLGRGTMEMLLAQPIGRSQLLLAHGLVTTLGLAGLSGCVWLGIVIGLNSFSTPITPEVPVLVLPWLGWELPLSGAASEAVMTPMSELVPAELFFESVLNLFAFGFALLGICTAISSFERYRWRVIGVTIGFYIVNLLLMIASQSHERFSNLKYLTYFTCYQPQELVMCHIHPGQSSPWQLLAHSAEGSLVLGPLSMTLLPLALGAGGYVVAWVQLNRRDLPAPL